VPAYCPRARAACSTRKGKSTGPLPRVTIQNNQAPSLNSSRGRAPEYSGPVAKRHLWNARQVKPSEQVFSNGPRTSLWGRCRADVMLVQQGSAWEKSGHAPGRQEGGTRRLLPFYRGKHRKIWGDGPFDTHRMEGEGRNQAGTQRGRTNRA